MYNKDIIELFVKLKKYITSDKYQSLVIITLVYTFTHPQDIYMGCVGVFDKYLTSFLPTFNGHNFSTSCDN
jgi:hypothetical protein